MEAELVAQVHQALGAARFDQAFAAGLSINQQEAVDIIGHRGGADTRAA
jgi:hypothetical protein